MLHFLCISFAFPLHSVQVLSDSWLHTVKPPHLRWFSVRDCLLTLRCDLLRLAVSADACVCTKKAWISLDLITMNPDDSGKLCWSLSFNHIDIKFYCADAAAQCPRPMHFSVSQWFHGMLKAIERYNKLLMLRGVGPSQSEATIPNRLVEVSAGWPVCRLADDAWYGMQGLMFDIHNLAWTLKCWTSGSFFPKMWSSQEAEVPLAKAFFLYLRAWCDSMCFALCYIVA